MDAVRLFVAVETPSEIRSGLAQMQNAIRGEVSRTNASRSLARAIKWVDPEGVHITLKFLGWVPASRVAAIADSLRTVSAAHSQLSLSLGRLGVFPSPQRARVAWVGLEGDTGELARLQREVERALEALGFEPEGRSFSPHITLARVREEASASDKRQLAEIVSRLPGPTQVQFSVDAISLMQSELSPAGARYTRLALLPLAGASH